MARPALSLPLKVSAPSLAVGAILFFTAFGTDYWMNSKVDLEWAVHAGLWHACYVNLNDSVSSRCYPWTDDNVQSVRRDWLETVQVMDCLALVILIAAIIGFGIFLYTGKRTTGILAFSASLASAFFILIACIYFLENMNDDREVLGGQSLHADWSLSCNFVALICMGLAGGGIIIHTLCGWGTIGTVNTNVYESL